MANEINANLISAAPKLLEALKDTVVALASEAENYRDADGPFGRANYQPRGITLHLLAGRARAVIAKAEGR